MTASMQRSAQTDDVVGLLDVGTAKTVCVIVAAAATSGRPRVLGFGVRPTRGLKAGVVVEMDGVEQAVRGAVADAERGAEVRVSDVVLSVACGRLKAHSFSADADLPRQVVGESDLERLQQAGRAFAQREGRTVLDLRVLGYRLDGAGCPRDPHGRQGRSLSADVMAITADEAPLRNLTHVLDRAGLAVRSLVPAPLASGLAATHAEDRRLGVLCVDMGAGTTQLAMFAEGHLLACDVIPVGGNHLTFDIARALSVPVAEAERIKLLYGTLAGGTHPADDSVACAQAGSTGQLAEVEGLQAAAGQIRQLVEARIANLLGHIGERIERSAVPRCARRLIVLTGGGSQVPGLVEATTRAFATPVHAARPEQPEGWPDEFATPAYATVVGMSLLPAGLGASLTQVPGARGSGGYLQRMGHWLRAGF